MLQIVENSFTVHALSGFQTCLWSSNITFEIECTILPSMFQHCIWNRMYHFTVHVSKVLCGSDQLLDPSLKGIHFILSTIQPLSTKRKVVNSVQNWRKQAIVNTNTIGILSSAVHLKTQLKSSCTCSVCMIVHSIIWPASYKTCFKFKIVLLRWW